MWLASYGLSGLALKYEFGYYVQVLGTLERHFHVLMEVHKNSCQQIATYIIKK